MVRFEYEITMHSADAFKRVVYYCSGEGACELEEVPADEAQVLRGILNERGQDGWELVQLIFGKDGLMACWKRPLGWAEG